MFGPDLAKTFAKGMLAFAIASWAAFGVGAEPARAALSDSLMMCAEGTESVGFSLPVSAPDRYSIFAYSVNGGTWQYSNWFYTSYGHSWMWNGQGWESAGFAAGPIILVGNQASVVGYEYRWTQAAGGTWVSLGSCVTTSFFGGGIVFTSN